jgi:hypothetical protein
LTRSPELAHGSLCCRKGGGKGEKGKKKKDGKKKYKTLAPSALVIIVWLALVHHLFFPFPRKEIHFLSNQKTS